MNTLGEKIAKLLVDAIESTHKPLPTRSTLRLCRNGLGRFHIELMSTAHLKAIKAANEEYTENDLRHDYNDALDLYGDTAVYLENGYTEADVVGALKDIFAGPGVEFNGPGGSDIREYFDGVSRKLIEDKLNEALPKTCSCEECRS